MTPPGLAGSRPDLPLLPVMRQALASADGRVALRLAPDGPLTGAAHRRRAVKALLQDAALSGGGQVFETAAGDLLLLAGAAPAATRAAAILARLAAEAPPPETWTLPADNALLLAWAEHARLAPPIPREPALPPSGLAGLDTLLEGLPLHRLVRNLAILEHPEGAAPVLAAGRLAARRLAVSLAALRVELGALASDPDLLRHAEDRIAARLSDWWLGGGQDRAGMTADLAVPLLVPLPLHGLTMPMSHGPMSLGPMSLGPISQAGPRHGSLPSLIGVLPLVAAADPAALARRRAALAAAGWGLALGGLDAAVLRLAAPAALAADLLLLRWSPALADRTTTAALRGGQGRGGQGGGPGGGSVLPDRWVLTGCDGPESIAWGRAVGIRRFAGPHVVESRTATGPAS